MIAVGALFLALASGVSAQNQITTDIAVGENQFRFTFLPTVDSIKTTAHDFCVNNQEMLGIAPLTEEGLINCHNPIAERLREVAVQRERESQPITTDITVGENQFRFTFLPTVDSIKTTARDFCVNNQEMLGIAPLTEEGLINCHNPIAERLREVAVQRERESQPITTDITVGENQFRFTFLPTVDSIKTTARDFCVNNQEMLGIAPLTEEGLINCHNPIAERLREVAVQRERESQPITTDITVGENQFRFTFLPTVDSIKTTARDFCVNNQEMLGIAPLTEEGLINCHNPIAERLREVAIQRSGEAEKQTSEGSDSAAGGKTTETNGLEISETESGE